MGIAVSDRLPVMVHAHDVTSRTGMLVQLRHRQEVRLVDSPDGDHGVVLVVARLDDAGLLSAVEAGVGSLLLLEQGAASSARRPSAARYRPQWHLRGGATPVLLGAHGQERHPRHHHAPAAPESHACGRLRHAAGTDLTGRRYGKRRGGRRSAALRGRRRASMPSSGDEIARGTRGERCRRCSGRWATAAASMDDDEPRTRRGTSMAAAGSSSLLLLA